MTSKTPSRYLWILRHGKAASDAPWGGGDIERPLTARGRRDATALGHRLATDLVHGDPLLGIESAPSPELAICSAAVRTRQTTDLFVKALGGEVPIDSYRSLYQADTDIVLQYLREIDEGATSALVVGHNPTLYQLVWELLGDDSGAGSSGGGARDGADRTALEAHGFPTCSLAVLHLEVVAWEDVTHGCAHLAGLFKPPYG